MSDKSEMNAYHKGFEQGQMHTEPSQKTYKMFEAMQKELEEIKIQTTEQQKDIGYIKDNISAIREDLKEFIKCSEEKFANKWTERVLIWGGSVVGAAILLAFMALILK